jgi:hypothetical protein
LHACLNILSRQTPSKISIFMQMPLLHLAALSRHGFSSKRFSVCFCNHLANYFSRRIATARLELETWYVLSERIPKFLHTAKTQY